MSVDIAGCSTDNWVLCYERRLVRKAMLANVVTQPVTQRILCPICRASNRADARFCQQCGNDVLLDNVYRITRVIKEGGMGVVYEAVDEDGGVYAVKEMHDRFTNDEDRAEGIQRFVDEANLLRALRGHPNIPQVYRSFIDEGRYYLSMEFIFGEDLEDILRRQKRFAELQVLHWADQLCDVLEFMHANGLIYHDMKPSNVMITRNGDIKVVDFGIAKLLQPGQRGTIVGTPGYAPPEQYQGITTVQSDVYALAATLHHLLTGRDPRDEPPFSFPPARALRRDISRETNQALEKALQMELADRFQSVSEFRAALPIPTGERRGTQPVGLPPRNGSTRRADSVPRPAARQAPPPPAPRPESVPAGSPRTPPARRQPARAQRRGGFGRAVRRLVATGAIATGVYLGALNYAPETVAVVREYVTSVAQYFLDMAQPVPNEGAPADGAMTILRPFETAVEVQVTAGANDEAIRQAFREAYLARARDEYPGAQLGSLPPSYVGGDPQELPAAEGFTRLRATLRGYINVQE